MQATLRPSLLLLLLRWWRWRWNAEAPRTSSLPSNSPAPPGRSPDSLVSWAPCFLSGDEELGRASPHSAFSFFPPTTHLSQTTRREQRKRRRGRGASYASARLIKTRARARTAPLNQEPENVCELIVSRGLFCFSSIP